MKTHFWYYYNGSFSSPEKMFSINSSKENTKFCLSLHYNANSYLFVNRKKNFEIKVNNEKVNFPTQFCFRSIFNGFNNATESRELSLNGSQIAILLISLTY